jgi:hypothetical protein
MTDRKHDLLMSTGAHRAWIGETGGAQARPVPPRDGASQWPARGQRIKGGNARHAAITKGLSNFPSYKSWAEKAKSNWSGEDDKSE